MKNQILRFAALASIMMLVTACPYQSKVPITPAEEKVNKKIFGEWISDADMEVENPTYYRIKKFNKTKYDVVEFSYSSYDSIYKETQYWMHSSTVGERTFMNIESAGSSDGFYLYYIEIGDKEFTLFEVSENIDEQFTSSLDLKKFVEKHMDLSFFYSKSETKYIKKPKK